MQIASANCNNGHLVTCLFRKVFTGQPFFFFFFLPLPPSLPFSLPLSLPLSPPLLPLAPAPFFFFLSFGFQYTKNQNSSDDVKPETNQHTRRRQQSVRMLFFWEWAHLSCGATLAAGLRCRPQGLEPLRQPHGALNCVVALLRQCHQRGLQCLSLVLVPLVCAHNVRVVQERGSLTVQSKKTRNNAHMSEGAFLLVQSCDNEQQQQNNQPNKQTTKKKGGRGKGAREPCKFKTAPPPTPTPPLLSAVCFHARASHVLHERIPA